MLPTTAAISMDQSCLGSVLMRRATSTLTTSNGGIRRRALKGALANGIGMWRLELVTELQILPLAYIRTPDGFVTSMQLLVPNIAGVSPCKVLQPRQ